MGEPAQEEGDTEEDYFAQKALFDACSGHGEAKATLCRALFLKDESAAKAFTRGDYESALSVYRLALWLLRDDNSVFDPFTVDQDVFEDFSRGSPGLGRFEQPHGEE